MSSENCGHHIIDGAGSYCMAVDMKQMIASERLEKQYPHKYFRTDCYGKLVICPLKRLFLAPKMHLVELPSGRKANVCTSCLVGSHTTGHEIHSRGVVDRRDCKNTYDGIKQCQCTPDDKELWETLNRKEIR